MAGPVNGPGTNPVYNPYNTGNTTGPSGANGNGPGTGSIGNNGPPPDIAGVTSASFAPTEPPSAEDIEAALQQLQKLYASSTSAEVIMSLLGKLMIEQAASQREAALNNRLMSREEAKGKLLDQAAQMEKAAQEMITGAIISLVMTVVASAVAIAGAGLQMKSMFSGTQAKIDSANKMGSDYASGMQKAGMSGASATKAGGQVAADTLKATTTAVDRAGMLANTIGTAISQLLNSIGGVGKAITDASSKEAEAEGARMAAMAQDAQAEADIAKEIQSALDEMIRAIINFLKELREAEANQMQALTRV